MRLIKKKILKRVEDQVPYLIRWSLFTCRWFTVKIHKIIVTDKACHHDHPWSFVSLILKGGYVEHTKEGSKLYGAGSLLYRPAEYAHRLEIFQPAYTLVVTFKKRRQWGFHTPTGWLEWFKYKEEGSCDI